jgi:pyruvate formate lyase activating enzyme
MKEARFYQKNCYPKNNADASTRCLLCPHRCVIKEGETGLCSARRNRGGTLFAESYGMVSSAALDPIEKKPFKRFYPGTKIFSIGGYGCTMACAFCQNAAISQAMPATSFLPPEKLCATAASIPGNIGVAFTYNEPLIAIEYILDAAPLLKAAGLKVVLVTNGMILPDPLEELLPHIDALNIDLKAFTPRFYQKHGGDLETVKQTITVCAAKTHVEVTTLVIPDENDSEAGIAALSAWLADVSPDIPLHLTRFFPRHHLTNKAPTPLNTIAALAEIARARLRFVF